MGPGPILECRGLSKTFRTLRREKGLRGVLRNFLARQVVEVPALREVDLSCAPGDRLGLIGANGAGKTTLVKCLVGIVPASAGSAQLFGRPSFHLRDAEKRRLSLVMGQRSQLWWDLPPIDSFQLLREIYSVEHERFERRVREYSERLGVAEVLRTQLRQLSLGQRMKMEFIGAFLHDPDVAFLDEPTIGLDLVSRETIRDFLRELNRERGVTIVLTSHDLEDIEEICERLVILDGGAKIYDGDLVGLQRRIVGRRAVEVHLEPGGPGWSDGLRRELEGLGASVEPRGDHGLRLLVPSARTPALLRRLYEVAEVRDLSVERQPLEQLIKAIFAGGAGELEG